MVGTRPYLGTTVSELRAAMLTGPPLLRDASLMPGWVRRILARGLDLDPDARWPSMDALVDALGRDPSRRRRRFAICGLVFAGLATAAGSQQLERQAQLDRCERDAGVVEASWGPTHAATLREAFAAADPRLADDAASRLIPRLDEYASQWQTTRRQVCVEAMVEGIRSTSSHSAAATCLEDRRHALAALVDGLASPGPRDIQNGVLSATNLPLIEACTDEAHLARRVAVPVDPERQQRIATLRRRLAGATAQQILGHYQQAHAQAEALRAPAADLDFPPLQSEVLLRSGATAALLGRYDQAAETLEQAVLISGRTEHDDVEMEALSLLAWVVGFHLDRYDEGLRLGRIARMTLIRGGQEDSPRAAVLLAYIASIHQERGDLTSARETYEEALTLAREHLGSEHPRVASALNNLGGILDDQGDFDGARECLEAALAIRRRTLGPTNGHVGESLNALGQVNVELERFDVAAEQYLEAKSIFARSQGANHPHVATAQYNLGKLEEMRGRRAQALEYYRDSLDRRLGAFGRDNGEVAASTSRREVAVLVAHLVPLTR